MIYLYCLTNSVVGESLNNGVLLYLYKGFNIFYKDVHEDEYSGEHLKNNLKNEKWLEKNAREHLYVVNNVMSQYSVIPFNFGVIYNNWKGVELFIDKYHALLEENIAYVRGCEEWTIKVYIDLEEIIKNISFISAEVAEYDKIIEESTPGKGYILKKKKNDLVITEIDKICRKCALEIYERVSRISKKTVTNKLMPKEYLEGNRQMVLNMACLVNKENTCALLFEKDLLETNIKKYSANMDVTGPWPPYSFIKIEE